GGAGRAGTYSARPPRPHSRDVEPHQRVSASPLRGAAAHPPAPPETAPIPAPAPRNPLVNRLFDVSGRHVLVTGGSRGIGEMITRGFVEAGATVYVSSRTAEACQALVDELGDQVVAIPADLSSLAGVQALANEVAGRTDRLDVLVNNAGTTWGADGEDYPDAAWDTALA